MPPPESAPHILSIRGVERLFDHTLALQATDLQVAENDFITILGPIGCGKSTLLRIVAGLDAPDRRRGAARRPAVAGPGADRGMVFQSYTLFPWLTVLENVCFGLRERGMPRARAARGRACLHRQGRPASASSSTIPKQLSGGMQQRIALARALANDPRILLMDEPFGALDAQTRELMQELLLGIWEAEAKTVLFVTHDIDEAVFMASPRRGDERAARAHQARTRGAVAAPAALFGEDDAAVRRAEGRADRGGARRGAEGAATGRLAARVPARRHKHITIWPCTLQRTRGSSGLRPVCGSRAPSLVQQPSGSHDITETGGL